MFEPVWLSGICENATSAVWSWSIQSSLHPIQCAVMQRKGQRWGSDQMSAVNNIFPNAVCSRSDISTESMSHASRGYVIGMYLISTYLHLRFQFVKFNKPCIKDSLSHFRLVVNVNSWYLSQFMTPDQVTDHVMGQVTCHRPFLSLSIFIYVCLHIFGHLTFFGNCI